MEDISSKRTKRIESHKQQDKGPAAMIRTQRGDRSSAQERSAFMQIGVQGHSGVGSMTDTVLIPKVRPQKPSQAEIKIGPGARAWGRTEPICKGHIVPEVSKSSSQATTFPLNYSSSLTCQSSFLQFGSCCGPLDQTEWNNLLPRGCFSVIPSYA